MERSKKDDEYVSSSGTNSLLFILIGLVIGVFFGVSSSSSSSTTTTTLSSSSAFNVDPQEIEIASKVDEISVSVKDAHFFLKLIEKGIGSIERERSDSNSDRTAGLMGRALTTKALPDEPFRLVRVNLNDARTPFVSPTPTPFFIVQQNDDLSDNILKFLLGHEDHVMRLFNSVLNTNPCYPGDNGFQPRCFLQTNNAKKLGPNVRKLVLDVGANHGFFSLLSASYGFEVISFDPQPHCALYCMAAIALSGFDDLIQLNNAFVGNRTGHVSNVKARTGCWGTFPFTDAHIEARASAAFKNPKVDVPIPVPTIVLDDILSPVHDAIVLIKIDVEGHELNVFDGLKKMILAKRVYNIVVEINKPQLQRSNTQIQEVAKLFDWLLSLGYYLKPSNYYDFATYEVFPRERIAKMFEEDWITMDSFFFLPDV